MSAANPTSAGTSRVHTSGNAVKANVQPSLIEEGEGSIKGMNDAMWSSVSREGKGGSSMGRQQNEYASCITEDVSWVPGRVGLGWTFINSGFDMREVHGPCMPWTSPSCVILTPPPPPPPRYDKSEQYALKEWKTLRGIVALQGEVFERSAATQPGRCRWWWRPRETRQRPQTSQPGTPGAGPGYGQRDGRPQTVVDSATFPAENS